MTGGYAKPVQKQVCFPGSSKRGASWGMWDTEDNQHLFSASDIAAWNGPNVAELSAKLSP
jgi:hypothetical protein